MEGYFTTDLEDRQKILSEFESNKNSNIELYLGNEIFLTSNLTELLKEKKAIPLNNTKYILFELPFNIKPMNINDMIFEIQSNGLVPILAHPERYSYFYKNPENYEEFVDKGVLLQLNFGSFDGQYGSRAKLMAEKLLKSNLAHFIATDVHRPNTLYPRIPRIIKNLNELVGDEKINKLTNINPNLLLQNKDIEIEKFSHIKWNLFEKMKMNKK